MERKRIDFDIILNEDQTAKYNEWLEAHKLIWGMYGRFIYSVEPSEIDNFITITSKLSGQSISFIV